MSNINKLILLLSIGLFASCSRDSSINTIVSNLLGSKIYNLTDLACKNNVQLDFDSYCAIYYIDSTVCFSCRTLGWNTLVEEVKDSIGYPMQNIVIVSPGCSKNIEDRIERLNLNYPILIDYSNSFYNSNNLPEQDLFRSLLIDKEHKVVCVGNPLLRESIKLLYIRKIREFLEIELNEDF